MIPKGPDRVFLWYWLGKNKENTNRYQTELPIWGKTLVFGGLHTNNFSHKGCFGRKKVSLKVDSLYALGAILFFWGGLIFQPWPIKKRALRIKIEHEKTKNMTMGDLTFLPNLPDFHPPRAVNANKFLPDAYDDVPMDDAWGDSHCHSLV